MSNPHCRNLIAAAEASAAQQGNVQRLALVYAMALAWGASPAFWAAAAADAADVYVGALL